MRSSLRLALGALLAAGVCAGAHAQDRRVPNSAAEMRLSFATTVKRTAPAVVNVYAGRIVQNRNPLFDDPLFRHFFGSPGMPRERVQRSLGSGVIVDASGFVVTNNHVVDGATEVKVALADRREFEAEVVLKDARTDLAILRIRDAGERFPALELGDSEDLEVGDLVLAIGNPFAVGQTVTHGIISALARTQVGITDYQFFIQTDAAINPGNSGGALVDMSGRLIGINTAIYSRSGGSQGIGFAIPSNMVRVVVASAKGGSNVVRRPWFGARLQAVTTEIADSLGLKRPAGALVTSVSEGSPADRAGLRTGDLVVAIDDATIDDVESFNFRFGTKPLGGKTELALLRAGRRMEVAIALEAAPETPAREPVVLRSRSPLSGATVVNLSPAVAEELRVDVPQKGVVIEQIENGSPAQLVGFQRGDVIVEINGLRLTRTSELEDLMQRPQRVWRVQISRGGQTISTVLGG